jgi:hypothetical protein
MFGRDSSKSPPPPPTPPPSPTSPYFSQIQASTSFVASPPHPTLISLALSLSISISYLLKLFFLKGPTITNILGHFMTFSFLKQTRQKELKKRKTFWLTWIMPKKIHFRVWNIKLLKSLPSNTQVTYPILFFNSLLEYEKAHKNWNIYRNHRWRRLIKRIHWLGCLGCNNAGLVFTYNEHKERWTKVKVFFNWETLK